MDKSVGRDKRRLDKHHKKPPPVKSSAGGPKKPPPKEPVPPSSAPLIVSDDHFSRRPIESNWNAGKNLPSSEGSDSEDEQLRAADFEKLLQMPPSVSGHFFLSTEKHWISESEEGVIAGSGGKGGQQYGQQHFQIDTKQLNASLATIPLHERNGYPSEIFSKREIDSMRLKAQLESKKYDELCQRLSGRMGDKQQTPKPPPVKCLIGAGALPPPVVRGGQEEPVRPLPPAPPQPMPCLVGPMALPPELRNDPNVTGSYAAASRVAERLREVSLVDQGNRSGDSVPIRSAENQAGEATSSREQKKDMIAAEEKSTPAGQESKEDIQQWLDDILDM